MKRRTAGFTLVEVLAALVITATAIVIVAQGFAMAGGGAGASRRLTRAAMLAESKMAEFESGELSLTTSASGDLKPDYPEYRFDVAIGTASFSLSQVTVTVSWTERGGTKATYALVRLLADRSSTGGSP